MKKGHILSGRYVLQGELRKGLFGDSYLALDEGTGLPVTVKIFTDRVSRDERTLTDMQRNFQLLHNLDHPNIVKLHALEYDATANEHFLVREYVDGITLTEYRKHHEDGKLPFSEAIDICRQIAHALDHAHRSLLHRDLKPDNVLISQSNEVKLINFCLIPEQISRDIRTESMRRDLESSSQTHGYLAPEQFFGFPPPGPPADQYALAAIYYELVSGHPPFDQPEPQALMHAVCNMAPPVIPEMGKRINQIINQAMSKDPGKRFPSSVAFIDAMDASQKNLGIRSIGLFSVAFLAIVAALGLSWYFKVIGNAHQVPMPPAQEVPFSDGGAQATDTKAKTGIQNQMVMLRIETRPDGAQVILDGKRLGVTPLKVGQVPKGRYALKLEKHGYNDIAVDMELAEDTVVDLSLDAILAADATVGATNNNTKMPVPETAKLAEETPGPKVSATSKPVEPPASEMKATSEPVPPAAKPAVTEEVVEEFNIQNAMAAFPEPTPRKIAPSKPAVEQPIEIKPEALAPPTPVQDPKQTGNTVTQETSPTPPPPTPGSQEIANSNQNPPIEAKQIRNDPRIPGLLQEGNRHLQAMRLTFPEGKNALENYQAVLAIDPDQADAKEGIKRIVAQLLTLAQEDIEEERLSQPEGKSAVFRVTMAGKLDPTNERVKVLLDKIAEKYVLLAKGAAEKNKLKIVEERLTQARAVAPDNPMVIEAYKNLLNKEIGQTKSQTSALASPQTDNPSDPNGPKTEETREKTESTSNTVTSPDLKTTTTLAGDITNPPKAGAIWKDPVTGMEFVELFQGCFTMGSEEGDLDESPVHRVCLDRYHLAKTEVTQGAWKKVMGVDNNPSKFNKDDNLPVDSVTWTMAKEFIRRLNEKSSVTFRLPTEAEWENACRAGESGPYQFGATINTSQANFNGSQPLPGEETGIFRRSTVTVGSFPANRFGLHDMHGNVYEWVEDWYVKDYYKKSPERNPVAMDDSSSLHVLRGGAWHSNSGNLRCSYRYRGRPDFNNFGNGFRLASSSVSN
ncbi:MAG: SUMF1/EgtB/PvdO family nonheme iron enzyme [Magnetococcales bacterium]|nr:SUMF1/EgtB/PvdO family nonheme iron enzyme [Magnetococcales bacterium]